ncbi:MAG: class I tRNA ligase family protein, partial [Acidobacteria bacterium]|nr:class I tRNA ligase family protein [Acidobacteriota bacterium]
APYRQVLTHGWVLDAQGRAMSKSIGNVIEPMDIIKTHGAEVLRLWAASLVLGEDIGISEEMITRLSEAYRKLRNTFRYCIANFYDFDPRRDTVPGDAFEEIDSWALARTAEVLEKVGAAYEEFAFHKVYRTLYDFATVDLSAFYFDVIKDRLYTAPPGSARRRAAQTVLFRVADALVRAISPLICFTADEVWSHLPPLANGAPREASVHMATLTPSQQLREGIPENHLKALENWPQLAAVRAEVLKALETARVAKQIGGSLEARVILQAQGDLAALLEQYRSYLRYLFIVSQVELAGGSLDEAMESELPGLRVKIARASGKKCDRCWNYSELVGRDARYPRVCERCSEALKEIESSLS